MTRRRIASGLWVLALLVLRPATADIFDYLNAPDDSYAWEVGQPGAGHTNLHLTSQTWQGAPWKHTITVFRPQNDKHPELCVLLVTGGSYNPQQEELMLGSLLANTMGVSMAVLWDIPNQPLWGMREDDLIAHSFQKALETGDMTWPLLYPMTKSAVRAMDALQAWSQQAGAGYQRFIITGASKRGWTTWFTGAVDPRVAAIMPLVYDNLNLAAQMPHQLELWGAYSPQIEEYTRRGLQAQLQTEQGKEFGRLVDPYTYRDRLTMPKLIVNGTNDAYWTVDALNLYRDGLQGETYQLYVPNSGHGLNDIQRVLQTVGGFVRLIADGTPRPEYTWLHSEQDGEAVLRVLAPAATKVDLWSAAAPEPRFTDATWQNQAMQHDGEAWVGSITLPPTGSLVVFGEATFPVGGATMTLSTTLRIYRAGK